MIEPPKPPETRVEFNGKFYSKSEFEAYKLTKHYKWVVLSWKLAAYAIPITIASVFATIVIMKLSGR